MCIRDSHMTDSTSTAMPAPETVLHNAEVEQSRRMAITGVLFNVFAIATSPLYGGHHTAKLVALVSFAVATLDNAWLWWKASDPRRYTPVSYTHLRAHETPEHLVCR